MKEKIYHIYSNNKCIFHSLNEEEFENLWKSLKQLADFISDNKDLSYEEIILDKEISLNSSH
jgi:hypothetical protein